MSNTRDAGGDAAAIASVAEVQSWYAEIWDAGKVAGIIQMTAAPGTYDPAHVENPYRA